MRGEKGLDGCNQGVGAVRCQCNSKGWDEEFVMSGGFFVCVPGLWVVVAGRDMGWWIAWNGCARVEPGGCDEIEVAGETNCEWAHAHRSLL